MCIQGRASVERLFVQQFLAILGANQFPKEGSAYGSEGTMSKHVQFRPETFGGARHRLALSRPAQQGGLQRGPFRSPTVLEGTLGGGGGGTLSLSGLGFKLEGAVLISRKSEGLVQGGGRFPAEFANLRSAFCWNSFPIPGQHSRK